MGRVAASSSGRPVALLVVLAARRRRARAPSASVPEEQVHAPDDGDAKTDQ